MSARAGAAEDLELTDLDESGLRAATEQGATSTVRVRCVRHALTEYLHTGRCRFCGARAGSSRAGTCVD